MKTPLTVAQLIERLKLFPQDAIVMLECDDSYYSGPLDGDNLNLGEAQFSGPYDWTGPSEDENGKPIKPCIGRSLGGWQVNPYDLLQHGEILKRCPCLLIRVTHDGSA